MSLAFDQLNLVHTVDSRTDVNSASRKAFAVMEGPNDVGYIHVTPDGGVSNSSMTFTINPPSARVFVNRRMLLNLKFRLTFTGVSGGAGQTLLQAAGMATSGGASAGNAFYDAPRAYPLANATNSMQVSINNDRLAQNLNLYFRGMTRYNNSVHQQDSCQSMTPSMLDQSQQYSDLDGFARSPLRGYGDNFEQTARGGFVGAVITQNTSTGVADTAIVELDATEFFWLSPFLFEEGDEDTGFIGVQNMMLTLQLGGRGVGALSGLAAALWSHSTSSPSTFSAIQVDVLNANVISSYLTPDTVMQIPAANNYPYSDLTIYPTQSGSSVPAGSQALIQMNNVQLNSIPSRMFVWVAPSDSTVSITSTDTYFRIDNVNISFDNHDAILSNATEQDLYQIAAKNRCNLSWTQWHKWTGSVLALDFGTDIPLRPLQAVGLAGSYNLRMTIQATNLSSGAVLPTLSVLVVSEGVMTIDANRVIRTVGILSRQDVLNTKEAPLVPHRARNSVYGGSFWDSIKNFFSGVARPALDVAKTIVPLVAPQFAPALGIADAVGRAVGVGRRPRAVRGGRAMPASRMLKLLH